MNDHIFFNNDGLYIGTDGRLHNSETGDALYIAGITELYSGRKLYIYEKPEVKKNVR